MFQSKVYNQLYLMVLGLPVWCRWRCTRNFEVASKTIGLPWPQKNYQLFESGKCREVIILT